MAKALSLILLLAVATTAWASRRDWTGSGAVRCVSPERARGVAGDAPHASTRDRFAQTKPLARCLACHGTGEAPAGPAIAVEVGCEACHGAGAAYAPDDVMRDRPVATALGLAELATPAQRAALCATCHARATRSRAFDPTAPVHGVTKRGDK